MIFYIVNIVFSKIGICQNVKYGLLFSYIVKKFFCGHVLCPRYGTNKNKNTQGVGGEDSLFHSPVTKCPCRASFALMVRRAKLAS